MGSLEQLRAGGKEPGGPRPPVSGLPALLTPCWGSDKDEDEDEDGGGGGDGLTEAAAATALPASAQPSPARLGTAPRKVGFSAGAGCANKAGAGGGRGN